VTRLRRLDIHAVRGIQDLSLDFDCGSIVLGGGNGTGKSACVDAIEFLYTGSIATLVGTQGLSLRQHGAHLHASPSEAHVTGHFDDPAGSVTRRLSGQLEVPVALEKHMAAGARLAFILRRSQLQHFIHAKPADRYRSMADLIGAEDLDRAEASLKGARDALEDQVHQGQATLSRIDERLGELPADVDDEDILREASERLAELEGGHRLQSWEDVRTVRAAVLRAATSRHDPAQEARARLVGDLERGIGADNLRGTIAAFREVTGGGRQRQEHLVDLLQLLRSGREYVRETPTDNCPLCEREMRSKILLERLVERVAQLEEVSLQEQRVQHAREDLSLALQETENRMRNLDESQAAAGARSPGGALRDAISMLGESMRSGAVSESREMGERVLVALERWDSWVNETIGRTAQELAVSNEDGEDELAGAVLAVLEDAAARRAAGERGRQELERLLAERGRVVAATARVERAFALADLAYRTFNRTKNDEMQRVYDELRADLARMYDVLHPGEGHGAVAIAMDPRKRGSSDLRMGFYGREDEDPRAFASEGHLDSLGLCIFLAFARRFNGDWPLLVLDDVVTSVDAAHKARVARLLLEEFGDRQLFITTYDSRWFLELQRLQGETGRTKVRNLVIESWSLEGGPKVREVAAATTAS
jgi:hypothetical protein